MPKSVMSKAERVCQDLARAGGISLSMGGIRHPVVIVMVLNPEATRTGDEAESVVSELLSGVKRA